MRRGVRVRIRRWVGAPVERASVLERVGKYQIKRELGRGTDSTVYLAYDEFYGSDVAVKVYNDATHAGVNDSFATAVNIWVALHGIVSLRTSRPAFPWPPVNTLIDAALQGQAGLQSEPAAPTRLDAPAGHDR